MDNFEYDFIDVTQSHIGETVEVRNDANLNWLKGKLLGIVLDEFCYVVRLENYERPSFWKMARVPVRLPYLERQKRCGIKVGDLVKITRMPESEEDGWGDIATYKMQGLVGTCHKVTYDSSRFGFTVGGWNFPYFVLEKIEQPVKRAKDLIDGEIVYTTNDEWIQILPRTGEFTSCDKYTSLNNEYNNGWLSGTTCGMRCRPARLLKSPSFSVESIDKTVVCVDTPNEKGKIVKIWICKNSSPCAQVEYPSATKTYTLNQLLVLED